MLQPANFREGDDVVWQMVWAAWRLLWKEDEITSMDAVQASSWAKSTMGTYCTHYGPLGRRHNGRRVGDGSMQVPIPALGAGVLQKLPTGSSIRYAGVGGDGLGARICQQPGMEMLFRQWSGRTPGWRSSGPSRWRVRAEDSGWYTTWPYCRSPASPGWVKRPQSGGGGSRSRAFTRSNVTQSSSGASRDATAVRQGLAAVARR